MKITQVMHLEATTLDAERLDFKQRLLFVSLHNITGLLLEICALLIGIATEV